MVYKKKPDRCRFRPWLPATPSARRALMIDLQKELRLGADYYKALGRDIKGSPISPNSTSQAT